MEYIFYVFVVSFIVSIVVVILGTGKRAEGFGGVVSDTKLIMRVAAIDLTICCSSLCVLYVFIAIYVIQRI